MFEVVDIFNLAILISISVQFSISDNAMLVNKNNIFFSFYGILVPSNLVLYIEWMSNSVGFFLTNHDIVLKFCFNRF